MSKSYDNTPSRIRKPIQPPLKNPRKLNKYFKDHLREVINNPKIVTIIN